MIPELSQYVESSVNHKDIGNRKLVVLTFVKNEDLFKPLDRASIVFVNILVFSLSNLVTQNGKLSARYKLFSSVKIIF